MKKESSGTISRWAKQNKMTERLDAYKAALSRYLENDPEPALNLMKKLRNEDSSDDSSDVSNVFSARLMIKLLGRRMAMKNGSEHVELFQTSEVTASENPTASLDTIYLSGEAYFVNGLIHLSLCQPKEAEQAFRAASKLYRETDEVERELLSTYNSSIARLEYDRNYLYAQVQRDFSTMRARAADKGLRRIEALTLRQLSYLYYDSERLNASVEFAEQALQLFELHGPVSDTDLLKAHLSLTHLRLGDRAKALFYFEQISFRPDERARLPVAVLKYLLIGEPVELANFQSISARWRLLFEECAHPGREQLRKFRWIASTGLIFDGKKILARVRLGTLEAQVLRMLAAGPVAKNLLCHALWPELAETELLDDRIEKLMRRLAKKLGGELRLEAGLYRLSVKLETRAGC